jgi:hypothetical protein
MTSPSQQPKATVPRSRNAIQLAFLDDPLVRFIGIFNPVLVVIALGWQELRDLINAVRTAATEGPGRKADRLTDFEFVLVHRTPPSCPMGLRTTFAVEPGNFNCQFQGKYYYHEIAPGGDFKGLHFVVYVASRLGKRCARTGSNH